MSANLLRSVCFLLSLSLAPYFVVCAAQSDTPPGQSSASVTGDAAQAAPAEHWNIAMETEKERADWVKPQTGWLYVLDPKPEAGTLGGRIWLVDPAMGKVMGMIRTGDNADFALSPDGSHLYVASTIDGDTSELAVIDTAQGTVIERATIVDREVTNGLPPFSTMAVSADGSALRILIDAPKSSDADSFMLATFDTQSGDFQKRVVSLGNCGPGRFISYPAADHFAFLCPRTNKVRLINLDADSRELQNLDVGLPWERRVGAAEAIQTPDSEAIAIVRGDGAVVEMNAATQEFADTMAHADLPNRVPPAAWPTSPDGSRLYLGYNNEYERAFDNRFYLDYGRPPNLRPENAMANQFRVLDTQTWRKIGTIKTKMPFWNAVIGSDGKTLYAMAPQKHSILVIDTVKMHQTGILKVGGAPALALVAP
jgi:hypothetical protein